jgi:hypothetical protein
MEAEQRCAEQHRACRGAGAQGEQRRFQATAGGVGHTHPVIIAAVGRARLSAKSTGRYGTSDGAD